MLSCKGILGSGTSSGEKGHAKHGCCRRCGVERAGGSFYGVGESDDPGTWDLRMSPNGSYYFLWKSDGEIFLWRREQYAATEDSMASNLVCSSRCFAWTCCAIKRLI